jgi:hypothetical protein
MQTDVRKGANFKYRKNYTIHCVIICSIENIAALLTCKKKEQSTIFLTLGFLS